MKIEPLLPGYIETYSLDRLGSVTLEETIKFHDIGMPPIYKTLVDPVGKG